MRKYKTLYLAAAITLTTGVFFASGFVMQEARLASIPFYIATAVLAYTSFAIWKWGKKPTERELADGRIHRAIRALGDAEDQEKCFLLVRKLKCIDEIYSHGTDALVASNNIQALQHLLEVYIRIVTHKVDVNDLEYDQLDPFNIAGQIVDLQRDLNTHNYSTHVAESKKATLALLLKRREATLQRISINEQAVADMKRIETQFDLALESAGLHPIEISGSIQVASDIMMEEMPRPTEFES